MGTRMDVSKGWTQEMLLPLLRTLPTLPDERYYFRQNFHAETQHVKYIANCLCGTGPSCVLYTCPTGQKLAAFCTPEIIKIPLRYGHGCRGLISGWIQEFAWMKGGKPRKTSATIAGLQTEICTQDLPNKKQECYLFD
jgi:hypothetical protein